MSIITGNEGARSHGEKTSTTPQHHRSLPTRSPFSTHGVTGAGKTTLLDVLAGRKTGGVIEGDIRVGGYPKVQQTFARISGYCEQTDIHSSQITVGESIAYSAWLRLPIEIDSKTRDVSYN